MTPATATDERFAYQTWLQRAYARQERPLRFQAETRQEWERWRGALREKLLELSGMEAEPESCPLLPEPLTELEPCPPVPETLDGKPVESAPGVLRQRIACQTEPGVWATAWLLRPAADAERPRAAVLALHGHASGRLGAHAVAGAVDAGPDVAQNIARYRYAYGLHFAQRGYVVLCPDARTFGSRPGTVWPPDGSRPPVDMCDRSANQAALLGLSLLALNIWDDRRGIDLLQEQADVDSSKIGAAGLSYGGTRALFLAALDERVAAAVVSGYLTTYKSYAIDRTLCGAQVIPGLLRWAEMPDVAALIAPRPLLIEAGLQDKHFQIDASREAHRTLQRAYGLLGAGDRLWRDEFDDGHRWSGRLAYDFMDRYLKHTERNSDV